MTEIKCRNFGCGKTIIKGVHGWVHILDANDEFFIGATLCGLVATPPPTGIKSEDTKPVGGVTREEVEDFLDDLHERPTLPTSREWLEEDGEMAGFNTRGCPSLAKRTNHSCGKVAGHGGYHSCTDFPGEGYGRWYTDGPFVEAK